MGDVQFPGVVALCNPKSGERVSAGFLWDNLNECLPGRVIDLSKCFADQTEAVAAIRDHAQGGFVVVAGGDGTVSFGMDIIDQLDWTALGEDRRPYIAVIPMGTGNDLSRCLGFGPGYSHQTCCGPCSCKADPVPDILTKTISAPKSTMDRWKIAVSRIDGDPSSTDLLEQRVMNNYFSIGFDAHIAKKFDVARKENPSCFQSRLMNKMWYGCFGCGALCGEPVLSEIIEMKVDGLVVVVPDGTKSLVVSNVDSFAGGVKLWDDSDGKFKPVSVSDGLVEVQAIFGSTHMGFMQVKCRSAEKIVQGAVVELTVKETVWMQWDGEAMDKVQEPCKIRLTHSSSPRILNASLGEPKP